MGRDYPKSQEQYRPHWKNEVKGFRCASDVLNVTLVRP